MARHYRHVRKSLHANDLRMTIEFVRDDLLFQSGSFIHPYLHRSFSLPYERLNGMVCGPNLLDMVELLKSSQPDEEDRFVIRDLDTLFQKPKVKDWKDKPSFEQDDAKVLGSFKKGLRVQGHYERQEGEYVAVSKRSTVSISRLVFVMFTGLAGCATKASQRVGQIASDFWKDDVKRSRALYEWVAAQGKQGVPVSEVPSHLFPTFTISQAVENTILTECCDWLGVEPDLNIERKPGRPFLQSSSDRSESEAGEVIELTLSSHHTLTGRVITDFLSFRQDTPFSALTVLRLAELLGELRQQGLEHDSTLLETYLDTVDPNWAEEVAQELGDNTPNTDRQDPYLLLGLERGCSLAELKQAFRRVMQGVHQDKIGTPVFAQMVNAARQQILMDIDHR